MELRDKSRVTILAGVGAIIQMWLYQLAFPQQCKRVTLSPQPLQRLFLVLSIFAILTAVKWYLNVVLI